MTMLSLSNNSVKYTSTTSKLKPICCSQQRERNFPLQQKKIEELVNGIFYVKFAILFILQKYTQKHSLTHQTHTFILIEKNMVTKKGWNVKKYAKISYTDSVLIIRLKEGGEWSKEACQLWNSLQSSCSFFLNFKTIVWRAHFVEFYSWRKWKNAIRSLLRKNKLRKKNSNSQ